jgi:arylsulfatase A-like enzyme/tetratricopeptide (TPR) repeat protein
MRAFPGSLIVLCLLLLASCSKPVPSSVSKPPSPRDVNVLLITLDTLRADHLSCYGSKKVATPNIDALAARGVLFTQAVAQVPLTTPSHASILTGTYPQVHKLRDNGGFVLDGSIPTLATLTKDNGFETAAFVGAAVLNRHFGLNRGFDHYGDNLNEKPNAKLLPGVVAELRGDAVTRRALDWLDQRAKPGTGTPPVKNFFLWAHYYDAHFPYDPPEPYGTRFQKDKYSGEIAYVDQQVGELLKGLAARGLAERTLVVLMADHGESLGDHGEFTHGVFLYDSTMHIPLMIAGPGLPAAKVITRQVRSIDVMPTVADYLGLSPGSQAQGISLLPSVLEDKPWPPNFAYMETLYPKTALGWAELRAVRTDEWKYVAAPKPELYHLPEDPAEVRSVKESRSDQATRLDQHVWEVAGARESLGKLTRSPVNDETMRQLQSLGYASAGTRRDLRIDMSGADPKDRAHLLAVLERVADHMNHDRFGAAVPLLEGILKEDPTNPLIYKNLGTCLQRLRQFRKAMPVYQQAIQNQADTDETHAEMGEILVRLGDLPAAANAMETAAEMNLSNLQNLSNLATLYLQMGRPPDVERTLKAILAQNPRHAQAYNVYGILEIQRGQGNTARTYFEKAVEYDPELTEPYLNLGLLAQEAGQPKIAVDYYKKFLEHARPKEHGQYIPKVKAAIAELSGRL